ncbi:MAG: CRISPR-associated primase-polymerase type B [Saprospiraceae bacterium]
MMPDLLFGTQITKMGDMMQKISPERLYGGISRSKQDFRDKIEQLRMVRTINAQEYKNLKKQLPYFVCGLFHPAVRRKEFFASIQYVLLDLDGLAAAELDKAILIDILSQQPDVLLIFTSPSDDGLKIMFKLLAPCSDEAMFSAFYKIFAKRFAEKHQLANVLDFKTSDVTRACFLSYDPNAFFNPDALPIDMEAFLPDLNFDLAEQEIKAADQFLQKKQVSQSVLSPDEAILNRIKEKLHPHYQKPKTVHHFVPNEVDNALPVLNEALAAFEMTITETTPIHYGRKLKVVCRQLWAEINLFYGKHGFRLVATTKSGSNQQLATLAAQAIEQILNTLPSSK